MPGLNVHADHENSAPTSKKKWNRGPKVILAVSLLLLIPVIGTSLASSVTVNGGAVTFGQGYTLALACDENVTITPTATFNYNAGSGYWYVDRFTLSGIDTTLTVNGTGCGGKTITIKALDGSGNPSKIIDDTNAADITFSLPTSTGAVTCTSGLDTELCPNSTASDGDSLIFRLTADIKASTISGFTIQQS